MLYKETIEPKTLELLIELQKENLLSSFNLVGGTNCNEVIKHHR